jgi:hypothetical protein
VGQRTNQKSNAKRQCAIDDEQLAQWEREVEEAVARRKGSLTTSDATV